ncbi:MAG: hypothetical protein ACOCV2_10465 [Persicimonas sp.]
MAHAPNEMPDAGTPKQRVLELVQDLPDDVSFEEIERTFREELRTRYIRAVVENAREDVEAGRTISHKELKKNRGIE